MKFDFNFIKDFADGLAALIKRAIATIKTFVESWKKPLDIITTTGEEVVTTD
ncbi:MAG: hypothetical protein SOX69_10000 [Oscillospiraceae bacterium]|nr:hypothetical protein [Oscillospiraceae bacterium]